MVPFNYNDTVSFAWAVYGTSQTPSGYIDGSGSVDGYGQSQSTVWQTSTTQSGTPSYTSSPDGYSTFSFSPAWVSVGTNSWVATQQLYSIDFSADSAMLDPTYDAYLTGITTTSEELAKNVTVSGS